MNHNDTNDLPLHIHDDNNGLDYAPHGDYYLPDLEVPQAPPLNRWGRMAFSRLQEHHPGRFNRMLLETARCTHIAMTSGSRRRNDTMSSCRAISAARGSTKR